MIIVIVIICIILIIVIIRRGRLPAIETTSGSSTGDFQGNNNQAAPESI